MTSISIDSVIKIDKKKRSSSLSRKTQIKNKKEKDGQIYTDVELDLNDADDSDDSNFE